MHFQLKKLLNAQRDNNTQISIHLNSSNMLNRHYDFTRMVYTQITFYKKEDPTFPLFEMKIWFGNSQRISIVRSIGRGSLNTILKMY